jgi:hypothetical protein
MNNYQEYKICSNCIMDTSDSKIVFDEKSHTNLTSMIVAVAPVRDEGSVLLPTLREQVAVPNQPLPINGETEGPLQLFKLKRLSSWVIWYRGSLPRDLPSWPDEQVAYTSNFKVINVEVCDEEGERSSMQSARWLTCTICS